MNGETMPTNWIIEDGAMKVFTGEGKNWDKDLKVILFLKKRNLVILNYQ